MPYCPHCGEHVNRCPRRAALCRWLCKGWEHVTGSHYCDTSNGVQLAAAEDISDIGPGWEAWREMHEEWAA